MSIVMCSCLNTFLEFSENISVKAEAILGHHSQSRQDKHVIEAILFVEPRKQKKTEAAKDCDSSRPWETHRDGIPMAVGMLMAPAGWFSHVFPTLPAGSIGKCKCEKCHVHTQKRGDSKHSTNPLTLWIGASESWFPWSV